MHLDAYTSDNICQALGLTSFASEPSLQTATAALRFLLMPSFHPEVCLTFTRAGGVATASVVAARSMVWHLLQPSEVVADRSFGDFPVPLFEELCAGLIEAAAAPQSSGFTVDGMPVDAVLLREGRNELRVTQNVAGRSELRAVVSLAVAEIWARSPNAACRAALSAVGPYVGLKLREEK